MNPEAVAHTLVAVEGKWVTEAVAYAQCNTTDATCQEDVLGEFKKSCKTVVSAIIKASNGDKSDVSEYLGDICQQDELRDWKKTFCNNFAGALNKVLTDDSYVNRDDLSLDDICGNFLTHGFVKEAAKEEIERAEKEKQRLVAEQEAEAKKEAEEKAAAEAEEAAKAKAKKAYEDAMEKKRAEMKAKADEAREKAAEEAHAEEVVANSSSITPGATAVNGTVNASTIEADNSDSSGANATTTTAVPVQATAEVSSNETAVSSAANTTATVVPKNTTK
jgi:hypothetical protein